jgi:hypothetical protein
MEEIMHRFFGLFFLPVSLLILSACGTYAQENFNIQPIVQYDPNWHDWVRDVAVANGYAFAACGGEGLRIISDYTTDSPAVIAWLSSVDAEKITVSGPYAYVADCGTAVRVVRIADPLNPVVVASVPVFDNVNSLRVIGSHLFVCCHLGGLYLVEITDPEHPQVTWQGPGPNYCTAFDVDVQGNLLYAVYREQVHVLDITDFSNPQHVDSFNVWGEGIRVSGNYAYLASGDAGFRIYDLAAREIVGRVDTLTYAYNLELREPYVYLHYGPYDCPLAAIDVSNPASPQVLSIYKPPEDIRGIVVDNTHAYVADGMYGIRTVDISDPAALHEILRYNPIGNFQSIVVDGTTAYAKSDAQIQIFSMVNPAHPSQIGYIDLPIYTDGLILNGSIGYTVASWGVGLHSYNLTDPASPIQLGQFDCGAYRVAQYQHYFYAVENEGLRIVDISDPANMHEAGMFTRGADNIGNALIAVDGNHLFVEAYYGTQILVLDLSDPTAPVAIDSCQNFQNALAMVASQGSLYELTQDSLKIFDTATFSPWLPVSVTPIHGNSGMNWRGLVVRGNYAYLTNDSLGLLVYDVSNHLALTLVGRFRTPGNANSIAMLGNLAVVADGSNLGVYDCSEALTGGANAAPVLPHEVSLLPNYPNPFNMSTQIPFELPARSRVTLTVYDILGRSVATLLNGDYAAGNHVITWQGTSTGGQSVASGQYFVRLQTPNRVQTRPITLLK